MNTPNPALVTQRAARRLPRPALLLLCAAYVVPGVFGRDPWRNADITAFGTMLSLADGRSPWFAPELGGVPVNTELLPYWLGAAFIKLLSPAVDPALVARIPFAALLALVLALTWYTSYHLARTEAAQPVSLAFGGEATTVDYARAIADATVLALIACLGLLQLGHETTPELMQLFATSLFQWALAAAPFHTWRPRLAAVAALVMLAGSGAPTFSLGVGLAGGVVCLRSSYPAVRRFVPWVGVGILGAVAVAAGFGTWAWRVEPILGGWDLVQNPRLWVWFLWPAWPLAAWTLWRWRHYLLHRHVSVPLVVATSAMLTSITMGASDRALLLGLPGLAVLAAFALPTLNRSTSAAIDWFSMLLFTLLAGALWVIYLSVQTGLPPQPAANVHKLAPGFVPSFSALPLAVALAATACWVWIVRWRTGRHREALWKSLVLPAGGVTLCWTLLATLGLPILDYARSTRAVVERVARHVPRGNCIAAPGQAPSLVAGLEYHGRFRVDAGDSAARSTCRYLVRVEPRSGMASPGADWTLVARERRPSDRNHWVVIYRRISG